MSKVERETSQNVQNQNSVSNAEFKEVESPKVKRSKKHEDVYTSDPSEDKIKELAESIEERGLNIPLVVNQNLEILSGWLRYLAAMLLGWDTIKVMVISIAEEDETEFIIGSNPEREKTIHDEVNEVMALRDVYLKKQGQNSDDEHTNKIISQVTGYSTDKIAKIVKIQGVCPALFNEIAESKTSLHSANEKAALLKETHKLQEMMELPPVVIKNTSDIDTAFMDIVKDYAEKKDRPGLVAMIDDKVLKPKDALSYIKKDIRFNAEETGENKAEETIETPVISMCPMCGAKVKKKEDQEALTEHYPKILKLKEDLGMSA